MRLQYRQRSADGGAYSGQLLRRQRRMRGQTVVDQHDKNAPIVFSQIRLAGQHLGNNLPARPPPFRGHGRGVYCWVQSNGPACPALPSVAQSLKLATSADVVIENFRPGALERWGLGPEQLKADNPDLIMVRTSGYGQTDPYKDRAGFASAAEAFGGFR